MEGGVSVREVHYRQTDIQEHLVILIGSTCIKTNLMFSDKRTPPSCQHREIFNRESV